MEYLDFELEIGSGSGREYPVTVARSTAGEALEIMHFPFDELALENQILTLQNALLRSGGKNRQILSSSEQSVQRFGRSLFDTLFVGEVRSRYAVSRREAVYQGKGLRLKLRIHPPELAALPWEFLYDSSQEEYVCLSNNTPIVRYLDMPQSLQPLLVAPPLRILGMIASPNDLSDIDVEREKQRVEKALESLREKDLVQLTWLQGHTWQDLQRAMRTGTWNIFHFIGHGGFNSNTDEGLIALENNEGQTQYLSATHLARLLFDHHSLRLVVLNSCESARGSSHDTLSSTAATLVKRGIPAVLAMQYEITDRASIELSHAFYEALADGLPVDMAVSEARKAISLGVANTVEWGTPVLYMRTPNGVLFNQSRKSTGRQKKRLDQSPSIEPFPIKEGYETTAIKDMKELTSTPKSEQTNLPSSAIPQVSSKSAKVDANVSQSSSVPLPNLQGSKTIVSIPGHGGDATVRDNRRSLSRARVPLIIALVLVIIAASAATILVYRSTSNTNRSLPLVSINSTSTAQTTSTNTARVNATVNVAIAARQNPYPPYKGKLLFDAPLNMNTKNYTWDEGNEPGAGFCTFEGDAYHAEILRTSQFYRCSIESTDLKDFAYQVQMMIVKGDQGGIVFRANDTEGSLYYFHLGTDGTYQFDIINRHNFVKTVSQGTNSAIRTGFNQSNLIAVIAQDNSFDLYVNLQLIAHTTDTTYRSGQIGVIAVDYQNPTEVVFKNAKAWTL